MANSYFLFHENKHMMSIIKSIASDKARELGIEETQGIYQLPVKVDEISNEVYFAMDIGKKYMQKCLNRLAASNSIKYDLDLGYVLLID